MRHGRRLRKLAVGLVALLCLSAFAQNTEAQESRLIIHRTPTFGNRQWLRIWIDETQFKAIGAGHDFNAPISPGHHVISVLDSDNMRHHPPTKRDLDVHPGQTYKFTAVWRKDRVVLEERR